MFVSHFLIPKMNLLCILCKCSFSLCVSVCGFGHEHRGSAGHSPRLDVLLLFRRHVHVLLRSLADVRLRHAALRHVSIKHIHSCSTRPAKTHLLLYFNRKVWPHLSHLTLFSELSHSPNQISQQVHNRHANVLIRLFGKCDRTCIRAGVICVFEGCSCDCPVGRFDVTELQICLVLLPAFTAAIGPAFWNVTVNPTPNGFLAA